MVFNFRIIPITTNAFWSIMAFIVGAYARTFSGVAAKISSRTVALSLALDA